ncbi:NAD(P)/FAD-dependent oxidoreductase [Crocinitomix catalasitica]|nr:NAD(P)/FAD-dependent oxidoreductase [Crocinitomix catalasitica]
MEERTSGRKIAIIGTGPISLLKAYLLASRNPKVQISIFDMRGEFGGAWYSDKSPAGHEIECGCHIWSYNPAVYGFIEKELGVKLDYLRPTPLFIGKNVKLPYSTKNFIDSYRFILKKLITFGWNRIGGRPNIHWKLFGKRNKYPAVGSPELIRALANRLKELTNVTILNGLQVESIKLAEKIQLETEDRTFQFDKAYITSVSKIKSVEKNGQTIDLNPERIDYNHYLIGLNKPLKKKMTYWRLMHDQVVHRITDISYQTAGEENLLLVGIKPKAFDSMQESEIMDHIQKLFVRLKLTDSHEIEIIKIHCYPTYYSDPKARERIIALDENLKLLHSTDLIYGMYYLLKEEKLI